MAFLSATAVLHIAPGPIMLTLFQQTLRHGFAGGFKTYLGVTIGEIGLVSVVAQGQSNQEIARRMDVVLRLQSEPWLLPAGENWVADS